MTADLPAALLSLGRLREVWPWLSDSIEPVRSSWHERDLSPEARESLDAMVREEREERVGAPRPGRTAGEDLLSRSVRDYRALAPSPAPASVAVLAARDEVLDALMSTAWRVQESVELAWRVPLRRRPGYAAHLWGCWSDNDRAMATIDFLSEVLPDCEDEPVVRAGAVRLATVDQLARRVIGAGEERRVVKAECPGCGRRTLYAEVGSENEREWVIRCARACPCRGIDCGCKSPTRYPGRPHAWLRWEWEQLARLLGVVGRLVDEHAVQVEVDPTGALWVDRATAAAMLSRPGEDEVTVEMVRKWVSRKDIPTMRHRGRAFHPLQPLAEAEYEARTTSDGRPRSAA